MLRILQQHLPNTPEPGRQHVLRCAARAHLTPGTVNPAQHRWTLAARPEGREGGTSERRNAPVGGRGGRGSPNGSAGSSRSASSAGRGNSGRGSSTSGRSNGDKRAVPGPKDSDDEERPRLAKVLARVGVASRRACEELIEKGAVRVNQKVVSEQGTRVDPQRDVVEIKRGSLSGSSSSSSSAEAPAASAGGKAKAGAGAGSSASAGEGEGADSWMHVPIRSFSDKEQLYYFAVNKPKGYICSSTDVNGSGRLAIDLLQPWLDSWRRHNQDTKQLPPRFFTVGRLDVGSTGLLFITNDGQWAQSVIHPSSNITKEYIVFLSKAPSRQQLEALAGGCEVEGVHVEPVEVEVLEDDTRLRVVVAEGKKHEVRVLVASAGMDLVNLKRVRVGGYRLPKDLGFGGFKPLSAADLAKVMDPSAQQAASISAASRAEAERQQRVQQQQQAAAAGVPLALRSLPPQVLDRIRRAADQRGAKP